MYNRYLTHCDCGNTTSKAYARQHGGKCKACVTGKPKVSQASNERLDRYHDYIVSGAWRETSFGDC